MIRRPRQHDEKHLAFIRQLPCLLTKTNIGVEAAHIRYPDLRAGKRPTGIGEKPDDRWTVPLSNEMHRLQHTGSERAFWKAAGIDPIFTALALYAVSGDHEAAEQIVMNSVASELSAQAPNTTKYIDAEQAKSAVMAIKDVRMLDGDGWAFICRSEVLAALSRLSMGDEETDRSRGRK